MPIHRTDRDFLETPNLLPASYVRSSNTVYALGGESWYIIGWNDGDGVLWLGQLPDEALRFGARTMQASVHWSEPFDVSMRLASPEVLARINA